MRPIRTLSGISQILGKWGEDDQGIGADVGGSVLCGGLLEDERYLPFIVGIGNPRPNATSLHEGMFVDFQQFRQGECDEIESPMLWSLRPVGLDETEPSELDSLFGNIDAESMPE